MSEPSSKRAKLITQSLTSTTPIYREHSPIKVHANGDVILRVGSEKELVLIQVSSGVLTAASEFFVDLFEAKLQENDLPYSTSSPKEVPMKDDDPQAILDLCMILHHRGREVKIGGKALVDVAVMCSKYDCEKSASLWVSTQLSKSFRVAQASNSTLAPPASTISLPDIMALSYIFDDPQHFWLASKPLVAAQHLSSRVGNLLPAELLGKRYL